jgi:hypothetical protein
MPRRGGRGDSTAGLVQQRPGACSRDEDEMPREVEEVRLTKTGELMLLMVTVCRCRWLG